MSRNKFFHAVQAKIYLGKIILKNAENTKSSQELRAVE